MEARRVTEHVQWMGAIDWHRRLFDSLIPLPQGTSYNAYLVEGSEATALVDTVDPGQSEVLLRQLANVRRLDYIVAQHAEQDHAGTIPQVLARYPEAKVVATPKGKAMLIDLLHLPDDRMTTVDDGSVLSLGGVTLQFMHMPWVHWPETMVTYVPEEKLLFTCDFLGSHLATSSLYGESDALTVAAAKRYYAEIMMPFRRMIAKHLAHLGDLDIGAIAPSHGPIWGHPATILDAYQDWVGDTPGNLAIVPFVSMHGSTGTMVQYLVAGLAARGVEVHPFDLTVVDLGELAMAMVDAATIIIGAPTVLGGAHPQAAYAASLANALRPKARYAGVVGSYGWAGGATKALVGMLPALRVELLDPVEVRGKPRDDDFAALDRMADAVADRHRNDGLL